MTALLAGERDLVVVAAPAGFGKTTAVADWLDGRDRPFSWIALEDHHDELLGFFTRLADGLESLCGQGRLRALVSTASGLAATEGVLAAAAAEDLGAAADGAVVVLDDLHVITTEAVQRALQHLVDHLPAPVTLVLVSRAEPPLALARLRAAGRVSEVRAAELAFDPSESEELLARAGHTVPSSLVARLNQRIEGWAVGLRLAALSLTGRADVGEFVDSFTGDNRFVADYLLEEVLDQQPERVRRFLLETSVLEELSAGICDAVLDGAGSAELLEDLVRRNVFVAPVDPAGRRFRYHALFADLLRARLHRRDPSRVSDVLRSAAAWCRDNGELDRALRYLVRAGAVADAADLVARGAPRLLMQGDIGRHRAWLGLFPPEVVRRDPQLLLTRAWSELFADRPQEALVDLARLERVAPDEFLTARAGQLEVTQAIAAWFDGRPIECIEHAHRSLDLVAETDLGLRCVGHLYCGVGEVVIGDAAEAIGQLDQARDEAERIGDDYTAFSAQVATGALHLRDGDLERARFSFRSALDRVDVLVGEGRVFPIGGAGHLGWGVVAFERFELETATGAFRRALADLRKTTAVDYTSLAYRRWSEAHSLRGHHREADEVIAEARQHLSGFGEGKVSVQGLDTCQARNALRAGDLDQARALVLRSAAIPQRTRRELDSPAFEQRATTIRLDLALDRPDTARDQLAELRALAGSDRGAAIEVACLEAASEQALGRHDEAGRAIGRALSWASDGGWLRLLVDADPAVGALLGEVSYTTDDEARLIAQARAAGASGPTRSDRAQPLVDPLTARELEVLAEVAAGFTNAQIADRLFISVGTTKRHVANIFVKLAATHRAGAIARARTLGIID